MSGCVQRGYTVVDDALDPKAAYILLTRVRSSCKMETSVNNTYTKNSIEVPRQGEFEPTVV